MACTRGRMQARARSLPDQAPARRCPARARASLATGMSLSRSGVAVMRCCSGSARAAPGGAPRSAASTTSAIACCRSCFSVTVTRSPSLRARRGAQSHSEPRIVFLEEKV